MSLNFYDHLIISNYVSLAFFIANAAVGKPNTYPIVRN